MRSNNNNVREAVVATLGVEPQVVTIALANLLAAQHNIDEVTVIYTRHPDVLQALAVLHQEFAKQVYPGIALRPVAVTTASGPVRDFKSPTDLQGLLRSLYSEMRRVVRSSGALLHFCLAGGRKMMSVFGMVVAQLLFGPEDRAWYLVTEGWRPGSAKRLHAAPGDKV
jgi:CRISPR-associated protein Csx14